MDTLQILNNSLDYKHRIDPKMIKFLMAYVECRSTSQAAKLAGLTTNQGNNILNKKDVQAALALIQSESGRKASFDAREILERTNEIAQVDPIDVFNSDGTVKDIKDIPADVRRAIKSIEVREVWESDANGIKEHTGFIKRITFWDKTKGLELLGKHESLFTEKVEHTHDIGGNLAAYLLDSEKRANEIDITPMVKLTGDPFVDQANIDVMKELVKQNE